MNKAINQLCYDIWIEKYPGYKMKPKDWYHLKLLIKYLSDDFPGTDTEANFKLIINNLPKWMKNPTLSALTSQYNGIISEINGKQLLTEASKATFERLFSK